MWEAWRRLKETGEILPVVQAAKAAETEVKIKMHDLPISEAVILLVKSSNHQ